ncbi:acyl-CoA thioesterase-2 [Paraburkholderia sp. BL6665CI2N2]|uniref:acyl-CoA thioesterase n=1 Tax=Paraburkholderia sp. BL6665CI2N2 TaxID=1938806 RepID=UPI0010667421|nr:acyl-CoA thioesterase II [Paraburkholderia sp. BL6665CI2N2]TDY16827.1 acyl-CoA thioesterase-2 [Paraburkholderia sp. BL6665CI2N2]
MDVSGLIEVLNLERTGPCKFKGKSLDMDATRVFGGQVVAQAIIAAQRCDETTRRIHSLHASFLRPGKPAAPIEFEASVLSSGRTFSTRQVNARQNNRLLFTMNASFQAQQPGLEHQSRMPAVKRPAELLSRQDQLASNPRNLPRKVVEFWNRPHPVDVRPLGVDHYLNQTERAPQQNIWLKIVGKVPQRPLIQSAVLAYVSDLTLLEVTTLPHGRTALDDEIETASLDHSMWFHRDVDVSQWLLCSQDSPSASASLGLARSQIFMEDGILVASTAQEGLIRLI